MDLVYSLVHKFDNTSTKIQTLKSGNATFIFKPPAYILCSNQQRCHRMIGWWRSTQIYVLTPSGVITLVRVKMALACKYFYFLFGWWVILYNCMRVISCSVIFRLGTLPIGSITSINDFICLCFCVSVVTKNLQTSHEARLAPDTPHFFNLFYLLFHFILK